MQLSPSWRAALHAGCKYSTRPLHAFEAEGAVVGVRRSVMHPSDPAVVLRNGQLKCTLTRDCFNPTFHFCPQVQYGTNILLRSQNGAWTRKIHQCGRSCTERYGTETVALPKYLEGCCSVERIDSVNGKERAVRHAFFVWDASDAIFEGKLSSP